MTNQVNEKKSCRQKFQIYGTNFAPRTFDEFSPYPQTFSQTSDTNPEFQLIVSLHR